MTLSINELQAITTAKILPKVVDNVFASKAFLKRLMRPEYLRTQDGGTLIQAPIVYSKPDASGGGFYSPSDALTATEAESTTAAVFNWKHLYEPYKISRADLLKNKGDAAKVNLLRTKAMIAQEQMTDKWGKGLFSDGTAGTGAGTVKQFDGLGAVMSESSTYGGIAVADVATWKANVEDNSSTLRPLTLNLIQKVDGLCSIDSKKPTCRVATQEVYNQAWALFTPHQRLVSEEMYKLGFANTLEINGVPLIVDSHADASTMYFINEEHLYMVAHPEENMRIEEFDKLEAFNGIMNRILFMGNLVCEARRLQGVLKDIKI